MKSILVALALAGCVAAVWVWGDRQAQELAEWRRVWGGVYAEAVGGEAPGEASVETLGRTVLKELESARKGGAEVKTSIGELEAKLAEAKAKGEAAAGELAKLKAGLAATEEGLRAKYAGLVEAAKADAAKAEAKRDEALKDLAAVRTRLADVEATLEAVINVPGDAVELGGEGDAEEAEIEGTEAEEAGEAKEEIEGIEGGEVPEAGEEEATTDLAGAVEEAEATTDLEEEADEGSVVATRTVGKSKLLLTLTYSEKEGTLDVLFRDGGELTYSGVPAEVAAAIRDAGDGVDRAARTRLKGKYPVEGDEEAVWGKSGRGGRKGKGDGGAVAPVALWVTAD